jgi:hypothetical protein
MTGYHRSFVSNAGLASAESDRQNTNELQLVTTEKGHNKTPKTNLPALVFGGFLPELGSIISECSWGL